MIKFIGDYQTYILSQEPIDEFNKRLTMLSNSKPGETNSYE